MQEEVEIEVDQSNTETYAPEHSRNDYANDRVLPNQSNECGHGIEDHERKNKQRNAPEYPDIPNSESRASIEI